MRNCGRRWGGTPREPRAARLAPQAFRP